ncbi:MAG: tetratricopeptide repeat protein [Candidatus Aminicenantes bacterium]|nr:tetratricopeptide repeat protein [Candidatus Aminicenantes bacterium]
MKKVIIILVAIAFVAFVGYRAYVNYSAKKKAANQPVAEKSSRSKPPCPRP